MRMNPPTIAIIAIAANRIIAGSLTLLLLQCVCNTSCSIFIIWLIKDINYGDNLAYCKFISSAVKKIIKI